MPKFVTKAGHGAQFDEFRPVEHSDAHGAKFDNFTRQASHSHSGSPFDEGFRGDEGANDAFERQLKAAPAAVRRMPAGCPSCGHRHTVEDALRAGRRAATGKRTDDKIDVRKTGAGQPDELHAALVASIQKTYGARSSATVAKSMNRGRAQRAAGSFDQALEILKRNARDLKT